MYVCKCVGCGCISNLFAARIDSDTNSLRTDSIAEVGADEFGLTARVEPQAALHDPSVIQVVIVGTLAKNDQLIVYSSMRMV